MRRWREPRGGDVRPCKIRNHGIKKPLYAVCCVLGSCLGGYGNCVKLGKESFSLLDTILDFVPILLSHPTRRFKWLLFSPSLPSPSGSLCRNQ